MQIPEQVISLDIPAQTVSLGYEVVSHTLTLSSGSINTTINAPAGKIITGAGFHGMFGYYDGANQGVRSFYPTSDGTGWVIDADFNTSVGTPILYLICINS